MKIKCGVCLCVCRCCASTARLGMPRPVGTADFLPRFATKLPFGQPRGGSRYADGTRNGGELTPASWVKPDGSLGGSRHAQQVRNHLFRPLCM
jgi:hypothetical protein